MDKRKACEIAGEGLIINPQKFVNYGIESSLVDSELGTCTIRHRDVVYAKGFDHHQAILLSHLAGKLVDAPKLGLRLRVDKWIHLLHQLKATIPEYIKPKGERRHFDSCHVMDTLVLQDIPQFLDNVLFSFNEKVREGAAIPIDADIKAFYEMIKLAHPKLVDRLIEKLKSLKAEWLKCIAKTKNDQTRSRDEITVSPRKKAKTMAKNVSILALVFTTLFPLAKL